jgi:hypothetical protein
MCLGESSQFVYVTSVSVIIIKTQNRQEKNQSKTAQTQHSTPSGGFNLLMINRLVAK